MKTSLKATIAAAILACAGSAYVLSSPKPEFWDNPQISPLFGRIPKDIVGAVSYSIKGRVTYTTPQAISYELVNPTASAAVRTFDVSYVVLGFEAEDAKKYKLLLIAKPDAVKAGERLSCLVRDEDFSKEDLARLHSSFTGAHKLEKDGLKFNFPAGSLSIDGAVESYQKPLPKQ